MSGIEVEAERLPACTLQLRYVLRGDTENLHLPPVGKALRSDELWRHTCFEAFVRATDGPDYCEFNFAPSTRWAAYHFEDYRKGGRDLAIDAPRIAVRSDAAQFELRATVNVDEAGNASGRALWTLGLAAVIEESNGNLSYWALAHPSGRPDFHRAENFALELGAEGFAS